MSDECRSPLGRLVATVVLAFLTSTTLGCGSGSQPTAGVPGAAKLLKEEDLYRYEGQGAAKKKVTIDLKERRRLLREAGEKIKSGEAAEAPKSK